MSSRPQGETFTTMRTAMHSPHCRTGRFFAQTEQDNPAQEVVLLVPRRNDMEREAEDGKSTGRKRSDLTTF
jgi:hypothetical protein